VEPRQCLGGDRVEKRAAARAAAIPRGGRAGCTNRASGGLGVALLELGERGRCVYPAPHMARHLGDGRERRGATEQRVGLVRRAAADRELAEALPGESAGSRAERGVEIAAPLETPRGLLPATLEEQRLSEQAPAERLGPHRVGLLGERE